MNDIRLFLDSLSTVDGLRGDYHIRDHISEFVLQIICRKAGYIGRCDCITDDDLMDCLHSLAYPTRKLDAVTVEESLRSIARSIAPATDAAGMLRFVEEIFDYVCKFVAELGTIDFFMVGGDVRGSWGSAPAQLFTLTYLEAVSPEVFSPTFHPYIQVFGSGIA